jgi:hypothetical protein
VITLADILVKDILPGTRVWLGGELHRVVDVSPGRMPHYTNLILYTGGEYQFPDSATLRTQYESTKRT